jgi:hypothetical protein
MRRRRRRRRDQSETIEADFVEKRRVFLFGKV